MKKLFLNNFLNNKKMKVHKRKISSNSKEEKKKRITISNSPCLKYSFTEFPYESTNIKVNTLTKNKTSKQIQQISKKNFTNMLNLKNKNIKNNKKINTEYLFHENSMNNLIKLKNHEIKKNVSKKKSRMKPQKIIVTMTNDFSFSNSNTPNNLFEDNRRNQRDILKNIFNYKHFRTNTFSSVNSNKNIINLKNNNITKCIIGPKSTKRVINDNFNYKLNELNQRLNNQLNENKDNKNKRYNSIQKIFEKLISLIPEESKLIFKNILIGVHDIINEYYLELKHLKEEYEINKNKLLSLENDNLYNLNIIKEKDLEIENLKKKISGSMSTQEQQIISKSTNSSFIVSLSSDKEKSLEIKKKYYKSNAQNRIEEINKKNIFDLNALYFYDKVIMKSEFNSVPKSNNGDLVPPLDLDFEKIERIKEEKKKENLKEKIKDNKLSFIQKVALSFDLN